MLASQQIFINNVLPTGVRTSLALWDTFLFGLLASHLWHMPYLAVYNTTCTFSVVCVCVCVCVYTYTSVIVCVFCLEHLCERKCMCL